jgi:hypothetical protein
MLRVTRRKYKPLFDQYNRLRLYSTAFHDGAVLKIERTLGYVAPLVLWYKINDYYKHSKEGGIGSILGSFCRKEQEPCTC